MKFLYDILCEHGITITKNGEQDDIWRFDISHSDMKPALRDIADSGRWDSEAQAAEKEALALARARSYEEYKECFTGRLRVQGLQWELLPGEMVEIKGPYAMVEALWKRVFKRAKGGQ